MGVEATVRSIDTGGSGVNYAKCRYIFTDSATPLGTNAALFTEGSITKAEQQIKKMKTTGTYYLHVLLEDNGGNQKEIISGNGVTLANSLEFEYTGTVQAVTLPAGRYKLECWGAQGRKLCSIWNRGKRGIFLWRNCFK